MQTWGGNLDSSSVSDFLETLDKVGDCFRSAQANMVNQFSLEMDAETSSFLEKIRSPADYQAASKHRES